MCVVCGCVWCVCGVCACVWCVCVVCVGVCTWDPNILGLVSRDELERVRTLTVSGRTLERKLESLVLVSKTIWLLTDTS